MDLMKGQPGITQVHGKVQEMEMEFKDNENISTMKFKLIPLFHPAAIIYNRTKLTPLWEADMEVVKEYCKSGDGGGKKGAREESRDK